MGFLKDAFNPTSLIAGPLIGGMVGRNNRHQDAAAQGIEDARLSGNKANLDYYRSQGAQKLQDLYGASGQNIGTDATDYTNRLKGLLDQNVAKSQQYLQNQSQNLARQNAKAGLRGVDTTAMNFQNKMNAKYGADVINEDAKRSALDLYGKNVSARQTGANQLGMGYEALALASQEQKVPEYKPGLFGSIFSGLF